MPVGFSGRLAATLIAMAICTSALAQKIEYLTPDEAIALEHHTRYSRLKRFVEGYAISPAPELHDYVVTADKMPRNFPHNVPVLRIVFPENTFFATGSAEILPSAHPIIAAMARMLDGDVPDVNLFVAGHTDGRGGEDYNHNLSIARARAVAQALMDARTQDYPIWSIGFGESLPLYPNTDDVNMSYNRRVEFLLGARVEAVAYWLKQQYDMVCQTNDPNAKLRCLLDLREVRHVYQAEEQPARKSVVLSNAKSIDVAQARARSKVAIAPKKITIELEEKRLYVSSIEH